MAESRVIDRLFDFLKTSPTPWHAVACMAERLEANGFQRLRETSSWSILAGGKYYVTRSDGALIAFRLPQGKLESLRMMGAHTDSPQLRLKPRPLVRSRDWLQLGVEVYGGALLNPWFDRDLGIAGRVQLRRAGRIEPLLVDTRRAVAVIPSLAIHMDREANQGRSVNAQTQMAAVLASLESCVDQTVETLIARLIEEQYGESDAEVLDFELGLYDRQAPAQIGLEGELFASARLDNLLSCFCALEALLDADGSQGALLVANDHEEVGSSSASGAHGTFLADVLARLNESVGEGGEQGRVRLIQRSRMISCDNAHGLHPNFADKHDAGHGPKLNGGPVIKVNANQRYATSSATAALFRDICQSVEVPVQTFVTRADMGCGSTIGPITASELGIATLDVGIAQWAMHSIRETAGSADPAYLIRALTAFCERSELD
ncbi:M18 family aminopeptidase [Halotalea alkalilenta]|uniref:M18 family aminopeptidase n=1 Tax=Halotalea alkalilenta TaxID=376489 RepID=A0A172YE13_9GAMM|nr:M18 family aminopeptidase [Halotalea alkalilenta]ANF57464.1 M18 family aminopeptidase [Halotalea alkalilenta]